MVFFISTSQPITLFAQHPVEECVVNTVVTPAKPSFENEPEAFRKLDCFLVVNRNVAGHPRAAKLQKRVGKQGV